MLARLPMISNTNIPNPSTASAKNTWGLSFTFGVTAGALIVAFGLLIPWIGFYWDDWPVILHARLGDASAFRDAYVYDRPLSFWTYSLLTPILGESPFGWHITSLLLRLATVLVFWAVLTQIWPAQKRLISWTTLLFAIYPVFTQQSISVAYSQHWLTYLLFFISIWAMLAAVLKPKYFWPLTLVSLASALLHLVTMEYFWGLELLRPFLLFLVLPPDNIRKRLIQILRQWLPYLILLTVLSIWRLFLLQFPEGTDPNTPELLYRMINQPVVGLLDLLRIGVQDITYMFFSAWFNTLQPTNFTFRPDFSMLSIIITISFRGLIYLFAQQPLTLRTASNQHRFSLDTPGSDVGWSFCCAWPFTDLASG
jgi:hypothetical protein